MHFIPMNAAQWILKNAVQKVYEITSDYKNINTAQQYCWHHLGDQIYYMTHVKNTGLCKKSGKTVVEVMAHFMFDLMICIS